MLQGANSTSKAVAKTKLANIKSKNARASLTNITMLFPPDTTWRRGWSYVQLKFKHLGSHSQVTADNKANLISAFEKQAQ